jgi:flagellar protein FlaI
MPENNAVDYEVLRDGEDTIIKINYEKNILSPSIEDSTLCMSQTIEKLTEVENATKIVFSQKRDYEYDYSQTKILQEIAELYIKFTKQKDLFNLNNLGATAGSYTKFYNERYTEMRNLAFNMLKRDPIGTYVELIRIFRREKIRHENTNDPNLKQGIEKYIELLKSIIEELEKTKLITITKPYLSGYKIGDREIYRRIFNPIIKPDFMFTKLMSNYPKNGIELDNYSVGETEVTIFELQDSVQYIYHIMPPEFRLEEDEYELLDTARNILAEHKPEKSEFVNPQRMREVFKHVGKDLIKELGEHKGMRLDDDKIEELASILIRYTVGFGLVEILLNDEEIQDVSVNSPLGHVPIFVVHGKYGDCTTNIIPSKAEAESWATKLRMISGRPLDEANQILDTELELPGASIRISVITEPLAPHGLGFSFRRHRDRPWTLPLFIKANMLSPLAAGLISFLVDGTRSFLICGTRGSGKSSFLTSVLVEIMRRYRIITIEDTLELPTNSMRRLGFNIQPMKVASSLVKSGNEMDAADGIRSTLRLGDSSLIVGEVRSTEAKALYEAMRVGAAANVVAGTIHGDSPYGIYDRVVNDIGVPKTSFKATDICIIANPVRSADGIHRYRRITQITEVRKDWENDPMAEKAFVDLMKYNAESDKVEPTDALLNGDSEILKMIAANIPDFIGNWDAVWENVELRGRLKEKLVKKAIDSKDDELLEAEFVIKANDMFHKFSQKVKDKRGKMDHKEIEFMWDDWLSHEMKKRALNKDEKKEEDVNEDETEKIYSGGGIDLSEFEEDKLQEKENKDISSEEEPSIKNSDSSV